MTSHPPSTIQVTKVEPCGDTKVCITMELVVDVHRLAEVGTDLLQAVTTKLNETGRMRKS
jgi:hypothetical protein